MSHNQDDFTVELGGVNPPRLPEGAELHLHLLLRWVACVLGACSQAACVSLPVGLSPSVSVCLNLCSAAVMTPFIAPQRVQSSWIHRDGPEPSWPGTFDRL